MRKSKPGLKAYDYVIVGSGFGGSVSALRLSEKGFKVLVIEKGKWYQNKDFPKTNWQLNKWLWLPTFRFFGIMKMTFFRHIGILSGVGVGGGSLVYANTLPKPQASFYKSGSWAGLADWESELKPYYKTAHRMLGATSNPYQEEGDRLLKDLSIEEQRKEFFHTTDVSVFFGEADVTVADPFFNGKGPERSGCNRCGACMTGCRHNAKNSLDKNYLYLAQQLGAEIISEHEVVDVKPKGDVYGSEGYQVYFRESTRLFRKGQSVKAKGVVFSGGVLGTIKLLLKLRQSSLPNISPALGKDVRTNNESLLFNVVNNPKKDFSKGIAIGSIYKVDKDTHLEAVRYGQGSGFWRLGMTPAVDGRNILSRMLKVCWKLIRSPWAYLKLYLVKDFAKQSIVLLFMQQLDSTLEFKKGWFRMKTKASSGEHPQAHIPLAHKLATKTGELSGGKPMAYMTESLFNIPSTAHILGGAVMGSSPSEAVVDKNNKVFAYKNMYICDGSVISANPGVNPSLTITAIAERAMNGIKKIK